MKLLNEYVSDLRELQSIDFATYEENKLIRRTVERTLHLAIEARLDIGQPPGCPRCHRAVCGVRWGGLGLLISVVALTSAPSVPNAN